MENKISIEIPSAVEQEVLKKFEEINNLLAPFVVTVPESQKPSLLKLGDKTIPFVDKTEHYTTTAPEYIPVFMDTPEFRKDTNAVKTIDNLYRAAHQLKGTLEDTRSLLGNDAYSGALLYYHSVKSAAKAGVAKAKSIYEDLAQRFPGRVRKNGQD